MLGRREPFKRRAAAKTPLRELVLLLPPALALSVLRGAAPRRHSTRGEVFFGQKFASQVFDQLSAPSVCLM